ncbi:hypothetical protein ACLHQH_004740 [Escherichia coli]
MVKVVEDERSRIRYLERRLNENGFYLPSSLADKDYFSYQKRVLNTLISQGVDTLKINNFLAETDQRYFDSLPSENDLNWYRNDARASLWLTCELYEMIKINGYENTLTCLSPESLPSHHSVRVDAIRRCIDNWPFILYTPSNYLNQKSIEWTTLLEKDDIFREVKARNFDICSWLKKYIQEKTNISLSYVCGESSEEIMAWCYASYFTWKKNNQNSPDSVELFTRKFKSAWATQKNRIKNRVDKKLRPLNVNISQEAYDKLRKLSMNEGISNDRVIESALDMIYRSKIKK